MPLSTAQLVLNGTLFLSPAHPALLKKTASDVWFSDPKAVSVQATSQGLLVRAKDESSGLQALGLDASDPGALVRVQNLSEANHAALQRCPRAPVVASSDGLLVDAATGSELPEKLVELSRCAFQTLKVSDALTGEATLAESFARKESEALAQGHRLLSSRWQGGRRLIRVDEKQALQASQLLSLFGPLAPLVRLETARAPRPGNTLIFEVTLFEFFRNAASKVGVSWPESFRLLDLEGNSFRSLNPALQLGLDFGESQGMSRVLARPQIRVKAGEKARFQSGGEIPVQVRGPKGVSTVEWKPYGLILDLAVPAETASGAESLSVDFKVELSEPDLSRGTDAVPGLSMRRLESRFDLRSQETTVLSTMLQVRSGALRSGLAGLSQAPVLKHVFSTKSQQEQESELWFAIRPRWDEIPWDEKIDENGRRAIGSL
jgi:hypothetical protein